MLVMDQKETIESYLKSLPKQEELTLSRLRKQISSVSPNMEERLSRGVPFFYYLGKRVVGYRFSKKHLSFFIMEGKVLKELDHLLKDLSYSSTVIYFSTEKPLPASLIKTLVKARLAEITAKIKPSDSLR